MEEITRLIEEVRNLPVSFNKIQILLDKKEAEYKKKEQALLSLPGKLEAAQVAQRTLVAEAETETHKAAETISRVRREVAESVTALRAQEATTLAEISAKVAATESSLYSLERQIVERERYASSLEQRIKRAENAIREIREGA